MRWSERDENGFNHKDKINVLHFDYQQTALAKYARWEQKMCRVVSILSDPHTSAAVSAHS
jgi:hypothetical protein